MKFSVVVPLYNKAPYVREAVESALAQTLAPLEVIVVDDGSTDGGGRMLASLRDDRVRLVRQSNAGVSVARNRGIELARGDWVAFLDADDVWHPGHLAALARAHRACPSADLLASRFRTVMQPGSEPIEPWPVAHADPEFEIVDDLRRRWMRNTPLCSSTVALRMKRLEAMPMWFAEGESWGEDLDMWFRIADHAPVVLAIPPYVSVRGTVPHSLSTRARRVMPPFLVRMRREALDGTLPERHRASALWFVAQSQVTLAREALAEGRRGEALAWLLQGPRSLATRRGLVTLAMVLLVPGHVADRWQRWRVRAGDAYLEEAA